MKTLIIQSDGMHKGQDSFTRNDYLRECYAIQHAFKNNDIESSIWGLRHDNYNEIPNFNSYDLIFIIENYEFEWIPSELYDSKAIKIQWIIDLHCQNSAYHNVSKNVDIILHSTKSLIKDYQSLFQNKKHIWFPNGVDDKYFFNYNKPKTIDLSFVGSKNVARKDFIEQLEEEKQLKYFFATGQDMINIISETKIHFNKNISVDVNYRNFETIGLGTCLLTDYNLELNDLGFINDINCIMYKTYSDAVEKIDQALKDNVWQKIAQKGNTFAKEHTYSRRIENLLKGLDL